MTAMMVEQPKQGVVQAVRTYSKRLFSFIRSRVKTVEEAEDILQDIWYQLTNVIDVEPIEQVNAWLFRAARNKIIDTYRKKKTDSLTDYAYETEEGDVNFKKILLIDEKTPESIYIQNIFWEELFAALEELPEKQRQVFIWNELEDKTLQEIANETGENLKTIISRKGYAVKHLRKRLATLYKEFLM